MPKKNQNDLIPFFNSPVDLRAGVRSSDIKKAIERFRDSADLVPLERLYTAYRSLKELIDSFGPDFSSQSAHFNDLFLRILEERGESGGGIYRSVLRDSLEFSLLNGILMREESEAPDHETSAAEPEIKETPPEKPALRQILSSKKYPLGDYGVDEWSLLVEEHLISIKDEKVFVKECSSLVARIAKRDEHSEYHVVAVIEYLFIRLSSYNKIAIESKDYAMKLLNLLSGNNAVWKRLHGEYLEIIRK